MSIRIYGNRPLQTLPGLATRPTSARVRAALFNILQGQISGSRWLDLCSGAGTIGAEALCRGAEFVLGIDQSSAACRLIRSNWTQIQTGSQSFEVIRGDARRVLSRLDPGMAFDFVYIDPPYESELYQELIPLISPFLRSTSLVILEHRSSDQFPDILGSLNLKDQRRYGQTGLSFFDILPNPPSS